MVDFLVPCQRLIELLFNRRNCPVDSPLTFIFLVVLYRALHISEPVILEREPYDLNVVFMQVEVVTSVRRLIRSDCHRVLIRPKNQEFSFYLFPVVGQLSPVVRVFHSGLIRCLFSILNFRP